MRGGSRRERVTRQITLGFAAATFSVCTGVLAVPALPAYAANCPVQSATPAQATRTDPAPIAKAVPWAQQRYDLDRLTGIADGAGQLVGVVDSGVDARHPQLTGAVVAGYDGFDPGGNGQLDCVGHGTAVASLIAARRAGGVGFRGIAPAAMILPVRVSEQVEIGGATTGRAASVRGLAQAIVYAVDHHVTVLNLSLVTTQDDDALRQAVGYAVDHNVVVVAAVGNEHARGDPTPYPAAYPGVIGVGAIGTDGVRLAESQVGPYVDLVAPGDQITAATRITTDAGYATFRGTSFATPFVAASAALVRQYHPELSAAAVAARLVATADHVGGESKEYGAGVVNPYRAVTERVADPAQTAGGAAQTPTAGAKRTRNLAVGIAGVGGSATVLFVIAITIFARGVRTSRPERQPAPAGWSHAGSTKAGG